LLVPRLFAEGEVVVFAIKALKARAEQRGISAEAEHRRILEQTLLRQKTQFCDGAWSYARCRCDQDFARQP